MDLEDIQNQLNRIMNDKNNQSIPEFEGHSLSEMHSLLHSPFGAGSPFQLQKLPDDQYENIPIINLIKYLANIISKSGEIKLTKKGFLPVKIVADFIEQGFIYDDIIHRRNIKVFKEMDAMPVHLTRLLMQVSGLAKKRNGKMSMTKAGEKIIADNDKLLRTIFEKFATRLNWAYFDLYGENHIGQMGFGFTLILLSKYGQKKRLDSFYADKYFKAFPRLLDTLEPTYGPLAKYAARCYSIRIFERFLDYFGLIRIENEGECLDKTTYITKTDLFDKLVKCLPYQNKINNFALN
jgi:hypothetical protein